VISRLLTPEHLTRVSNVLRRRPLIWDNLHANDYDNKRIFLGPYSGRPILTKQNLAGIVTNPNCEFEANFVAMHTLAYWSQCQSDAKVKTGERGFGDAWVVLRCGSDARRWTVPVVLIVLKCNTLYRTTFYSSTTLRILKCLMMSELQNV
jgi:beta-N-acetylglucosaminidase